MIGGSNFKYAFKSTAPIASEYQLSDKDTVGRNVIPIPEGTSSTSETLWVMDTHGNVTISGQALDYSKALQPSELNFVSETTKRIDVAYGENSIIVTDTKYTNMKYILVKFVVNSPADYWELKTAMDATIKFDSNTSNPVESINSIKNFFNIYNKLVPEDTNAGWIALPGNKEILEPLDTQTDDYYAVWIMGVNPTTGLVVKDLQLFVCKKDVDSVVTQSTNSLLKTRILRTS